MANLNFPRGGREAGFPERQPNNRSFFGSVLYSLVVICNSRPLSLSLPIANVHLEPSLLNSVQSALRLRSLLTPGSATS